MKGPGYMAVTAGEVAYVVKCIPVEVKITHPKECYAELQVSKNNATLYLTPRTHILKAHGTQVSCNRITPSLYLVDEGWIKLTPEPVITMKPWTLKPNDPKTWTYEQPTYLATSGIYTEKDLEGLRERIMFPIEKAAVLNGVAREINGHTVVDTEGSISRLINDNVVDKLIDSTWGRVWNKFITFGSVSAGIMTILIIIQTIKTLIEVLINGYLLHQIYGWSLHLFAAIWNSITHLLIYKNKPKDKPYTPVELIHEDEEDPIPLSTQPKKVDKTSTTTSEATTSGFFSIKP